MIFYKQQAFMWGKTICANVMTCFYSLKSWIFNRHRMSIIVIVIANFKNRCDKCEKLFLD